MASINRIPLGLAFASTSVNATVFRASAVVTAGPFQYATYYDPSGAIVVAQRRTDSVRWNVATLPVKGNVKDAHNDVVIGVSADGILHISYDHHAQPLHYRRSARPHDIRSFGDAIPMTGQTESHVTYPQFIPAPDGTLYFFYRDGASGNGNLCLNRLDAGFGATWKVLRHPLVDGQGKCNPYWWRPAVGPDGTLHVAWCWRDTGDARTNHDICYMRSSDRGETFRRGDGGPQPLPVTRGNAYIADPIPMGSNLINQCSSTIDAKGRPHLAHYQNDDKGVPQYTHLWFDGNKWTRNVVSDRKTTFTLSGGGTLRIPISRPEIAVGRNGALYFITRDEDLGGGIRLYRSITPDFTRWEPIDITPKGEDLGEWEPSYDTERLRLTGILSLFVLRVTQGNHETVTAEGPQPASLIEMHLE